MEDVSFDVDHGRICALLGSNGAGKTTVLRMMVGLTRGSGTTLFEGRPFEELRLPRRQVGTALAPILHPHRRVRSHLRMVAAATRVTSRRVDAILDTTGLAEYRRTPIKALSYGLQQRLNIAIALIGDPAIVLLDEPTNGLDPSSAAWFRDYLAFLAGDGKTILVSSHHLLEADSYADDVVILDAGRVRACGSVADMREALSSRATVRVRTSQPERLADMTIRRGGWANVHSNGVMYVDGLPAFVIAQLAARHLIPLHELTPQEVTLEQIFHDVCSRTSSGVIGG